VQYAIQFPRFLIPKCRILFIVWHKSPPYTHTLTDVKIAKIAFVDNIMYMSPGQWYLIKHI